jgi:chemotaxis protein histidine kinase CheA
VHTEKDNNATLAEHAAESVDSSQESTLNWLMDELDKDEPTEKLFVVDGVQEVDLTLSAFEAEIAARPMVRGRAGADEFDSYVGEEIVISSEGGSDIFSSSADSEEEHGGLDIEEAMALDFSRHNGSDHSVSLDVEDGSDILGLEDDDEMGDSYLVVKRAKKDPEPVQEAPVPPKENEAIVLAEAAAPVEPERTVEPVESIETAEPIEGIEYPEVIACDEPAAAVEQGDINTGSVAQYIADNIAPTDDQAFDDYLVAGSELQVGDEQIDDLSLVREEDDTFLDVGPDELIELPEEIKMMAEESESVLAAVTPLVGPLMDELGKALAARLGGLGMAADAVFSDLSLATDTTSEALAREQGYAPVMEICTEVPECLASLAAQQLQAIYLRLCWAQSGKPCNDLFLEEQPAEITETPALSPVESTVFGDDLLGDDLDANLAPEGWQPGQTDIDAVFDDLGVDEFTLEEPVLAAAEEIQAEPVAQDTVTQPTQEQAPQVFDEDIFDTELLDEALSADSSSTADIDALFDDLGESGVVETDICGIHVEEFAEAGSVPELPDVVEIAAEANEVATEPAGLEDMSWCIPADIKFSHSSPANTEIFAEFLDAFVEEGSSELEKLEDAVAAWESDINSEDAYSTVTRTLHTIKGIAKGVGLHYYGTLIHNFETLLEGLQKPAADEEHSYFRIVNAWLDASVRGLDHIQSHRADIRSEFPNREEPEVEAAPELEVVSSESVEPVSEPVIDASQPKPVATAATSAASDARRREQDKKLADEGARALAAQQSVRITSEKLDLLLNLTNQAQQLGVRTAQSAARNKRTSAELQARLSSVRAHISDIADRALFNVTSRAGTRHASKLDALEMDQYSELQEAANILREGVEDLAELVEIASRNNSQAEALLKQQATVISSIGSSMRGARVVPVSRLMPGLRRLVRTVSNDLGKEVAFRVANEVGTLDRDDYARCQTVLEHMVRNALDHGIESGEERKSSGKPSVGQITLDVRMSGSDSVIVLSDDGRGIDPDSMRESAIRKGLDVDAYALSDEDALNLIFHKGFSTAKSLSQISGRGVGMDIVLSELQQMGGEIRIESSVGQGTSFHIRIPSNVTVNGALLVSAGEASYAIPLGGLISVDEVPVEDFFAAVDSGEKLSLAGLECEPAYLGTLCHSGNLPDHSSWRRSVPVILAGSESRHMAIAVDDVEEALELVIRSLGAQFASVPGVAGAATTADGEAVVALDLNVLVACFPEEQGTAVAVDQPQEDQFLALVVDDSRTQRMVATSQLETVGIETATAENGAVAIDWLNTTEHLPDVILLDVEMPVKDGIQTLREIRKSARYSHIPVIMVTSRTGIKHRTLAEEAGCNGYMGKPFNFRMLIGQINELTGHRLQLG